VIGDVDNDSEMEVIFGSYDGTVYILRGIDGGEEWSYRIGRRIRSHPAITNLDNDPAIEIIVGADDSILRVFDGSSYNLEWSYKLNGKILGGICVVDLEGDGSEEVIVPSYVRMGEEGMVYVFRGNGDIKWTKALNSGIVGGVGVSDIDEDNSNEIVVVTYREGTVYFLSQENGTVEWSWNPGSNSSFLAPPTIEDVTGDGRLDVLVTNEGQGKVYCLNFISRMVEWSYVAGRRLRGNPACGDIDSDGGVEVVVNFSGGGGITPPGVICINGSNGREEWVYEYPVNEYYSYGSPLLVDLNSDGILDIVSESHVGRVYGLSGEGALLWDDPYFNSDLEGCPAAGDIDGDRCLEIVSGGYIYDAGQQNCVYAIEFRCVVKVEEKEKREEGIKWKPEVGKIRLLYNLEGREKRNISIYDVLGRELKSIKIEGKGEVVIKVRQGIYYGRDRKTKTGEKLIVF
jgi:hypothetical protein